MLQSVYSLEITSIYLQTLEYLSSGPAYDTYEYYTSPCTCTYDIYGWVHFHVY